MFVDTRANDEYVGSAKDVCRQLLLCRDLWTEPRRDREVVALDLVAIDTAYCD
jgi:hypothetical protein